MKQKNNEYTTEELLSLPQEFSEKIILKQLLLPGNTNSSVFVSQNFNSKWFSKKEYGDLFTIANSYWNKYHHAVSYSEIKSIASKENLIKKVGDLSSLIDEIYNINENDYDSIYLKDMIVRFTKERAIYFTIIDNIDIIQKHNDINICFTKFEEISKYTLDDDLGVDYFDNISKHIQKLTTPNTRVSTGFKNLDYFVDGGIPVNDTCLFLFMAQPGLGKSMFLSNIAANWILNDKNVLIITLEMSEEMYSYRMDSLFSNINLKDLKNIPETLLDRINLVKKLHTNSHLQIKEFPTGTCNTIMIKQYIKKLKETKGFIPDLIVVDYLNIMRPNCGSGNLGLYERGKAIAEELRALSCELHTSIISATQANRNSRGGGYAGEDIDMDNSSESSGIPATCDVLLGLFKLEPDQEIAMSEDKGNMMGLKIIKNRLGGKVGNVLSFNVNYDILKITDSDNLEEITTKDKNENLIKKDTEDISNLLDSMEMEND